MEIHTEINTRDEDEDKPFSVVFKFNINGTIININIEEPYLHSRKRWIKFCNAIQNRKCYYLSFYQGNGNGYLECDGDYFISSSQISGSGGDLSTEVKIEISKMVTQLLKQ